MLGAAAIGVLIVLFVGVQQLGGRTTSGPADPGIEYPASIVDGNALGDPRAPVTLDVWEDFQCPVCARHSLSVEPVIVARYVKDGTLRIVHHDLAFLGTGTPDESVAAAAGAVCAKRQGLYWPYTHWVYGNQNGENAGGFRPERLRAIAVGAGVDVSGWDACVADPGVVAEVQASTREGTGLGVSSTPTMFINGDMVTPPGLKTADALAALIEEAAASAVADATP